jgi:hypothetical protein
MGGEHEKIARGERQKMMIRQGNDELSELSIRSRRGGSKGATGTFEEARSKKQWSRMRET